MDLTRQVRSSLEPDAAGNNLLKALKPSDRALLGPLLVTWSSGAGTTLYEPGDVVEYVYFPCGPSLVSYRVVLTDGHSVETALVGREGAVGGIVSQGQLPAYARAIVQFPGPFLRAETKQLEQAKLKSVTLRHLFARYADCFLAQVFQSVACNATHTIEQRTAKWLLATIDRTGDHVVPLTQDQLAGLLGVGRSYVSRVIQNLKGDGILETRRGSLHIRDFDSLCEVTCSCNDLVRSHFDTVLNGIYPTENDLSNCE